MSFIEKIPFDAKTSNVETARQIVFARLRADTEWRYIDKSGDGYARFVEYTGQPGNEGRWRLVVLATEVFWLLVGEGILSPGKDYSNPDLPWFHITAYGQQVLDSAEPQPYDQTGYLADLRGRIGSPDPTVMAYVAESLETFRKGNPVSSTVMLGIAAERVFILLCNSLESALRDHGEKAAFTKLLKALSMKPKLDWVHDKFQKVQKLRLPGFPDNANIMTITIYDLLRCQRNELGHPREYPPNVKRADAFVNLQVFPRFYELAEEVRAFLVINAV